ncbi:MAG: transporter substrate-binding domain-containing protein [Okeania sp. SIO3C4]|nr:transporter substrate-binding domain-containing protein [Okeania sp. SIO3C4]
MKTQFKPIIIISTIIFAAIFPGASWASVLQEIEETGVLKVGIRKDAVLFGYENSRGEWVGFCRTFADALANSLSQKLNNTISVKTILSNLQTREAIVRNGTVHFECGPNTIDSTKEVKENIKYSTRFFITSTRLIVKPKNQQANSNRVGVLRRTTNLDVVAKIFPTSQVEQISSRTEGVRRVNNGSLAAFAGDDILLIGEAVKQGLSTEDYRIVPEKPLSCDYYGMILPANDFQWHNTINSFIESNQGKQVWQNWFSKFLSYLSNIINYCQNK